MSRRFAIPRRPVNSRAVVRIVRLARYCARNPVALSRLAYQSDDARVTYHSDKPTGPTAGSETLDVLAFLARVAPDKGQVFQR